MQSTQIQSHTKSVLYLPRLAFHEQINAIVLFFQDVIKVVLEPEGFDVGLARYGNSLALAWCGVFFDNMFDVVVVDVVCATTSVDLSRLLGGPCPECWRRPAIASPRSREDAREGVGRERTCTPGRYRALAERLAVLHGGEWEVGDRQKLGNRIGKNNGGRRRWYYILLRI